MAKHIGLIDREGVSSLSTLAVPQSEALDPAGWSGVPVEAAGLFCFEVTAEPGAEEFAMHAVPGAWVGYVVSGGMTLYSGKPTGEKLDEVELKPGDWLTFDPDAQHAWKNGPEKTRVLFVKQA
ncbi:MAG: cupin domain-containing protein [Planctomycetota bacterium]